MDDMEIRNKKGPANAFSIALLLLMLVVMVFLILMQNIDRFSDYFGGTTFKIVFDVALVALFIMLIAYVFSRSVAYRKELETMVKRLQNSNLLLQTLNAIQSSANSTLDADEFLEQALETVMTMTSSRGVIYLFDEETSRLQPRSCYGMETPLENLPDYAMGEGMIGWVAQHGQPLRENAGSSKARSKGDDPAGSPRAHIALPINSGNRVVGVMFADSAKGPYSEEELTLFDTVTEVMGNSLTNTKLYDITRRALDTTKRTQSYLESFILAAKIGVLVLDNKGVVLIANQEAESYLQTELRDVVGKNAFENLDKLGWRGQRLLQGLTGCLSDKAPAQYSHPMDDDPTSLATLVNVFPLFRDKEELIGAAATFIKT